MVHWQNVEHILKHGMCCRDHVNYDPNYVEIGMRKLIGDRHIHPVPFEGAGNLGEYVPFYFAGHSPMLYLIRNGYSGVQQRPQDDIVFLVCEFEKIKPLGLEYCFTDKNAKIAVANFYRDEADFDKLDWNTIRSRDWKNDDTDLARKDKKQAEFLIRKHVPVTCLHFIVVNSEARKVYFDELITNLGLSTKVYVDVEKKLYF